jgi:sugar phosphate permease
MDEPSPTRREVDMKEDPVKTTTLHYGWIVMGMGLLTTIAAHGLGRMAYTLILPSMKDGLQFSYQQLGLLGTGNFIGYLSLAIIGGFLAARFGTRIVITLALILMGVTMVLTGFSQTFGFAFLMRLLTGFGNGAAYVPAMALGSVWFSVKRRGFATGIVSGGIGVGTFIAGLIVPAILKATDQRAGGFLGTTWGAS